MSTSSSCVGASPLAAHHERRLPLSPARRDIDDIIDYIANDSPRAAERVRVQLQATCELLATTPEAGRRRDQLGSGIRSFPVSSYVILYRPIDGGVEIVRVLHGRRDIDAIVWE